MKKDLTAGIEELQGDKDQASPIVTGAVAPKGTFAIRGRLGTTENAQNRGQYNLQITNEAGIAAIEAIANLKGFDARNAKGEYWARVSLDTKGKLQVKRAANGARIALVEGVLTYQEFMYDIRGHLTVAAAKVLDGVSDPESRVQGSETQMVR